MERGFTNFGLSDIVIIISNHQNILFHEMHSLSATVHKNRLLDSSTLFIKLISFNIQTFEMKNSMAISYSCFCCNRNENIKIRRMKRLVPFYYHFKMSTTYTYFVIPCIHWLAHKPKRCILAQIKLSLK